MSLQVFLCFISEIFLCFLDTFRIIIITLVVQAKSQLSDRSQWAERHSTFCLCSPPRAWRWTPTLPTVSWRAQNRLVRHDRQNITANMCDSGASKGNEASLSACQWWGVKTSCLTQPGTEALLTGTTGYYLHNHASVQLRKLWLAGLKFPISAADPSSEAQKMVTFRRHAGEHLYKHLYKHLPDAFYYPRIQFFNFTADSSMCFFGFAFCSCRLRLFVWCGDAALSLAPVQQTQRHRRRRCSRDQFSRIHSD